MKDIIFFLFCSKTDLIFVTFHYIFEFISTDWHIGSLPKFTKVVEMVVIFSLNIYVDSKEIV